MLTELRQGRKTTHWIRFIFPQLKGLGCSSMAQEYAISSLEEAKAYLEHPLLGPRLRECSHLSTALREKNITGIMGSPDDLKLRSCMTLFAHATSENDVFLQLANQYYKGELDPQTLKILGSY